MALKPLTIDDVLETLNEQEREEVLRDDFKIPLELFLAGVNRDRNRLTALYEVTVSKCRKFAKNRVAVRNEIKRNPDILKTPINGPVVIIGLGRTGTTLLQRLLACDSQFVSPMLWEMVDMVPPGRPENWRECERYKRAQQEEEFKLLVDGFMDSSHVMRLELPEECLFIMRNYFLDIVDALMPCMSEWRDFTFNCPAEHLQNAYDYYKKCLQCIFYGGAENKTLLLKSSIHLVGFEEYRRVFPNVKVIFPYRNLKAMIGSYLSISHQILRQFGSDDEKDKPGIVAECFQRTRTFGTKAVEIFKTMPEDSFITIGYAEMVKDPMAIMHRIYSKFGFKMSPGAEEKMRSHLADKRENTQGKHKYDIADYGVTEEQIYKNMAEYVEYFKDGPEKL